MGVGLALGIAGAAVAAGGVGYGMYGAHEAAGDARASASEFKKSVANAMKHVPHVDPVKFDRLELPDISTAFTQYLGQGSSLKGLTKFAGKQNAAWQSLLDRASPGLTTSVRLAGNLVQNRLLGNLSAETQGNVTRSAAYRALQGGFGASSSAGRALEARDLGRTTEDLQTQGFSMLPQQGQMATALTPVSPHTLLFNPAQLLQRADTQAVFNTQVSNSEKAYNTSIDFENQNAKFQALLNQAGLNYQANQQANAASAQADQAIASGITNIGGIIAGMGGFGGASAGMGGTGSLGGQVNWGGLFNQAGAALSGTPNAGGFYTSQSAAQSAYGAGAKVAYFNGGSPTTSGWYLAGY